MKRLIVIIGIMLLAASGPLRSQMPAAQLATVIQEGRRAKVFFIGDTNSLEFIPQPLVDNLVAWGF